MDKLEKIKRICTTYHKWTDAESAILEILSLLGESELGVLDSQIPSHGDLLAVGESHASGADTAEDSENTSAGTLGKIIDSESSSPIFIDGGFNLSYGEKLYGSSTAAKEWRKQMRNKRKERKNHSER